jgi:hypothetical protein
MNGGNPGSQFSVQAARVFALWLADARSDDQVNDKLDLRASINELTRLKKSIKEVFNKNLGRVELRSCLVGLSKETLDVFKFVFGAASVSAPVVFDGYGRIDFGNFTSAASSWNDFRSRHPRRIQQGVSPNRVAVAVTRGQGLRVEFHGIAQSAKAVRGFVERNYTSSAAGGLTEPVALEAHAFIASNAAPMFPADAAYRNQLQIV